MDGESHVSEIASISEVCSCTKGLSSYIFNAPTMQNTNINNDACLQKYC